MPDTSIGTRQLSEFNRAPRPAVAAPLTIKYAFPAERGSLTRGIPTAYAAPPLNDIISAEDGDHPPVWPDPECSTRGYKLEPLYPSVPKAAKLDRALYELLALVDAIREGRARERNLAVEHLHKHLRKKNAAAELPRSEHSDGGTSVSETGDRSSIHRRLHCWPPSLKVDVMPTDGKILGFSNSWYDFRVASAFDLYLDDGTAIRLVSAPAFVATKLDAFQDSGHGDFTLSHDLEDIIAIVDGRPDLVPEQELKDAWPFLDLFAELDFPKLDKNWWPMGRRTSTDALTLRELLTAMTTLNAERLLVEPGSDDEIWVRLTKVIQRQLNVNLREIQPDASFTRDLGVD